MDLCYVPPPTDCRRFYTDQFNYHYNYYFNCIMEYQSRLRSTGVTDEDARSARYASRRVREDQPLYKPPQAQDSEGYKSVRESRDRVTAIPKSRKLHSSSKIKSSSRDLRDRIGSKRSCEPEPDRVPYQPERIVIKPKIECSTPFEDYDPEQSDSNEIETEERDFNLNNRNAKKPNVFILKYCLDKRTQRIIARLQNDFRMTNKYVTFSMYEKPKIPELKPTPVTTARTMNDRFKCLFTDLSREMDINAQNVDLTMELEHGTEKGVLETLTAEVENELCNP
ncbi:uncharacterized protein LOC135843085 [Planococcus citri]|uniref:uncharacterized protein LOC135843085 n=1 Tax=Planococcus citri TaxID=170843 RepID=UPI0031F79E13